ncbi:MAG: phosphotransferase [Alphaproteobacteria bacterium]
MNRQDEITAFLNRAGWGDAERIAVPGDASTRGYERLKLGPQKAVLMDAPKAAEAPSEPEGASVEDRRVLGYNALARLAGPNMESFTSIAKELTKRGFSAPHILGADLDAGFVLLEDLGDGLFARVIEENPALERPLYEAAIDTLAAIYRCSFPDVFDEHGDPWRVRAYDQVALQEETDLFLEWFTDDVGASLSEATKAEWYDIWADLFTCLNAHAPGLALRDFHAENLFWLPEREATARVGLIDFQDGLFAHPAYDLVSLLEDARRDVTPALREEMIKRFCEKSAITYDAAFKTAYAVMGAQRNAKILGIFVRLAKRDGKPHYRDLIPRVAKLFTADLDDPQLTALKQWVETHVPDVLVKTPKIKTAMVLAAGHGTRMRPLTDDRSKAMVEVGGKPLIDHMLDRLAAAGVERAVVNVHAHADHLETHLITRKGAPEIIISDERAALLETGGGVVKALSLLGEEPIFICNIDAIWTENTGVLAGLIEAWDAETMDDLLLLAPIKQTLGYPGKGDFDRASSGEISRRAGDHADYVYAGVQICKLDKVSTFTEEPFSRNKVWDLSLQDGTIYGHVLDGFWMHVGDPQARAASEERLKT